MAQLTRFPEAEQVDDIVVYRWDAPLFFANAGIFRQEILTLVKRRKPRWVVLQCEAITDIDVTAADMLVQLDEELNSRGINVVFVEMRSRRGPPRPLRAVRHAHPRTCLPVDRHGVARDRSGGQERRERPVTARLSRGRPRYVPRRPQVQIEVRLCRSSCRLFPMRLCPGPSGRPRMGSMRACGRGSGWRRLSSRSPGRSWMGRPEGGR